MKKITVKTIVNFRRGSDRSKNTIVSKLSKQKEEESEEYKSKKDGGDYWVSSLSAIGNTYKGNDSSFIKKKIDELSKKLTTTSNKQFQARYKANLEILYGYEDFAFKNLMPSKKLRFLSKKHDDTILLIQGIPVQAWPHHVFLFEKNGVNEVGAIWFIAKKKGYTQEELGIFSETMYRYLSTNFSEKYNINSKYCLAVDVINRFDVSYSEVGTW